MRRKSPVRTRRIKYSAIVGAVLGIVVGAALYSLNGFTFGLIVFPVCGAIMGAAATAVSLTDYDFD